MRIFKRIDLYLQALGAVITLGYGTFNLEILKYFYPVMAGLQLISILIHLLFPRSFYISPLRQQYYRALLILVALGFLMLIPPAFLAYLFLLTVVTPFYACWYFLACYRENILLEKKAFIHLK
ncbi:MAG: hypothetical protein EOO09_21330 [Chitinophagaceae bacterium]|nr:MAG: hypothetical protein EOO09_21330 [Chitinophagaceae bacterium]